MRSSHDLTAIIRLIGLYYTQGQRPLKVFHVGGFDGSWDVQLATVLGEKLGGCLSCEPHPHHYELMCKAFTTYPNLVPLRIAVGAVSGKALLYGAGSPRCQASSLMLIDPLRIFGSKKVVIRPIMEICQGHDMATIDLLRVNCEGSEYMIFDMVRDVDFLQHTNILQLCLHGKVPELCTMPMQKKKQAITNHILAQGFDLIEGFDFKIVGKNPMGHAWQVYSRREPLK